MKSWHRGLPIVITLSCLVLINSCAGGGSGGTGPEPALTPSVPSLPEAEEKGVPPSPGIAPEISPPMVEPSSEGAPSEAVGEGAPIKTLEEPIVITEAPPTPSSEPTGSLTDLSPSPFTPSPQGRGGSNQDQSPSAAAPVEKLLIPIDWFKLEGSEVIPVPGENKLILRIPLSTVEEAGRPESRLWLFRLMIGEALAQPLGGQASDFGQEMIEVEFVCQPFTVAGDALEFTIPPETPGDSQSAEAARELSLCTIPALGNSLSVALDRTLKEPTDPRSETLVPTLLLRETPKELTPSAPDRPPVAEAAPKTIHDKEDFQRQFLRTPLKDEIAQVAKSPSLGGRSWTLLPPSEKITAIDRHFAANKARGLGGMGEIGSIQGPGILGQQMTTESVPQPRGGTEMSRDVGRAAGPDGPTGGTGVGGIRQPGLDLEASRGPGLQPLSGISAIPAIEVPTTSPEIEVVERALQPIRREFFSSHPWIQAEMGSYLELIQFPQWVAATPVVSVGGEPPGRYGLLVVNGAWLGRRVSRAAMVDTFEEATAEVSANAAVLLPGLPSSPVITGIRCRLAVISMERTTGAAGGYRLELIVNGGERRMEVDIAGHCPRWQEVAAATDTTVKYCPWTQVTIAIPATPLIKKMEWILKGTQNATSPLSMRAVGIDHIGVVP